MLRQCSSPKLVDQQQHQVRGTGGNLNDADVEVKGYSTFGDTTGVAVPAAFTNGAGSVVIVSSVVHPLTASNLKLRNGCSVV